MNVELNTTMLIKKKITADEWLWLYLLNKKAYDVLLKYNEVSPVSEILENLVNKRLVHYDSQDKEVIDFNNIVVRSNFTDLIDPKDYFDDILAIYPVKVIRVDGTTDYLRVDLTRCRKDYAKIIKNNKDLHTRIVELLKFEIAMRTRDGKLAYMKRLPKWLLSEEWLAWEQHLSDTHNVFGKSSNSLGYGHELS